MRVFSFLSTQILYDKIRWLSKNNDILNFSANITLREGRSTSLVFEEGEKNRNLEKLMFEIMTSKSVKVRLNDMSRKSLVEL
jgi:outer membrane protease